MPSERAVELARRALHQIESLRKEESRIDRLAMFIDLARREAVADAVGRVLASGGEIVERPLQRDE